MECPISQLPLVDPVVAEDGYTYSRKEITRWLQSRSQSPVTFAKIGTRLIPNKAVASLLGETVSHAPAIIVPVVDHETISDLALNLADLFYDHSRVCLDVLESYKSLIRISSRVPHTLIYPMAFRVGDDFYLAEQSADGILNVEPVVGATAWVDLSAETAHTLLQVRAADEAHEVEADNKRVLELKMAALKKKLAYYMHVYNFDGLHLVHDDLCLELHEGEVDVVQVDADITHWPDLDIGNGATCFIREKESF
jgi:hypothetical protein